MGETTKSHRRAKVVVLSRDASFERAVRGEGSTCQYYCLRVTSPYETAAELLTEPPLAIVVDLRCLTPGDLPLIEMARQQGLEVLAVGAVPLGLTTADLSGVRLSTRDHLSNLLEVLASAPPSGRSVPEDPQPAPGAASELSALAKLITETPHTVPAPTQTPTDPPIESIVTPPVDPPKDPVNDEPPGASPEALLTQEELTALLEDE